MKFGEVPLGDAAGAILAHSVRLPGGTLRKGRVLDDEDLNRLKSGGLERVTVARLEKGDLSENDAAARVAPARRRRGRKRHGPRRRFR